MTRPLFHTVAGRIVHGGGGITPDVEVEQDSLLALARDVERRGLAFRFANRWISTHPDAVAGAVLPTDQWDAFVAFVRAESLRVDPTALRDGRPSLERAVRREIARSSSGGAEAMRVVLEGDHVFERAASILEHSTRSSDVFATTVRDPTHVPVR